MLLEVILGLLFLELFVKLTRVFRYDLSGILQLLLVVIKLYLFGLFSLNL